MSTITVSPPQGRAATNFPTRGLVVTLVLAVALVGAVVLSQQDATPQAPASLVDQQSVGYWEEITAVTGESTVPTGSPQVDQATASVAPTAATAAASARLEGLAAHYEAQGAAQYGTASTSTWGARYQAQADAIAAEQARRAHHEAEVAGILSHVD